MAAASAPDYTNDARRSRFKTKLNPPSRRTTDNGKDQKQWCCISATAVQLPGSRANDEIRPYEEDFSPLLKGLFNLPRCVDGRLSYGLFLPRHDMICTKGRDMAATSFHCKKRKQISHTCIFVAIQPGSPLWGVPTSSRPPCLFQAMSTVIGDLLMHHTH